MITLDNLTTAINNNSAAVTDLTASVDAAVADINTQTPTDAQINALTSVVDSNTATVNAQTARLNAAVNPPVVVTAPGQ